MKKISALLVLTIAITALLTTCKKNEEKKVELPTISTLAATEITATTAKSGGNVTNDGGGDITSKGILWSTTQNPTFEQHTGLTVEGKGTGLFQSMLTGLSQNTTFFIKAYATNSAGTTFGSQVQFKTEMASTAPEAAFYGSQTSGTLPLMVNFTDQSTNNPTSWAWDFGDGTTSTQQNPAKTYANAGNYTVKLTATNSYGSDTHIKSNYIEVTTGGGGTTGQPCPGMPTFTDSRDGNIYNTVQIGNQCWMKENLKFLPTVAPAGNGSQTEPYYYVFSYNGFNVNAAMATSNFQHYGALYNWPAAITACPTGWHLANDTEWTQLVDYVVAQGFPNNNDNPNGAGNALKSCRQVNSPLGGECNTTVHPYWNSHVTHHGFDVFGFSALPGGYRSTGNSFVDIGNLGYWWSSTENSSTFSWYWGMLYNYGNVRHGDYPKGNGFSVRCLRD